jgi:hypothetical protein
VAGGAQESAQRFCVQKAHSCLAAGVGFLCPMVPIKHPQKDDAAGGAAIGATGGCMDTNVSVSIS